jgi:hypothetical protein
MSLTFPAAFCFDNKAETATISASNSLPLCPPSRLQTQHIGEAWCTETDSAYLTIALASAVSFDTIGLFGLNLTTAAATQARVSLVDTSGQTGELYNSGSATGRVSSYYGNLVFLIDGAVTGQYIRIDLSEAGIARILAGYLMIGLRHQVGINFAQGASDAPIDPSIVTPSRSGAEWSDERTAYRQWEFSFDFVSETERFGWIEDMDRLRGATQNVMMIRNCASSNLGRDTLCGRITNAPPSLNRDGYMNGAPAYSKAYTIKQRL